MKLTIELVPQTAWYSNVRSIMTKRGWDIIRKKCYEKANYVCEICGKAGKIHPVECHEIWEYDDANKIQTLVGLIALCPSCHMVKHAMRTISVGKEVVLIKQLMKVNNITEEAARKYILEQFEIWQERSKFEWKIDIDYIESYMFTSKGFAEDMGKQIKKDTWGKGRPMIYMNEKKEIVEHWKDGIISILKNSN